MLLAAGRGERMRSYTDALPKPLLPIGSKTLIEHNLERLKKAGITEVVINVSYLAKQIIEQLGDGERFGLSITYSYEPDKPLGTGGGIFQALQFLGEESFLVLSSDIWTDYDFYRLFDKVSPDGHLILVDNPVYNLKGDYALLESGCLSAVSSPKLTYASFGVLHPRLFDGCQPGYYSMITLLEKAMLNSAVTGEIYRGEWFNVGTPEELKKLRDLEQNRSALRHS